MAQASIDARGEDDALTAEIRMHLGQCLIDRKDLEGARVELRAALQVFAGDPELSEQETKARAALASIEN